MSAFERTRRPRAPPPVASAAAASASAGGGGAASPASRSWRSHSAMSLRAQVALLLSRRRAGRLRVEGRARAHERHQQRRGGVEGESAPRTPSASWAARHRRQQVAPGQRREHAERRGASAAASSAAASVAAASASASRARPVATSVPTAPPPGVAEGAANQPASLGCCGCPASSTSTAQSAARPAARRRRAVARLLGRGVREHREQRGAEGGQALLLGEGGDAELQERRRLGREQPEQPPRAGGARAARRRRDERRIDAVKELLERRGRDGGLRVAEQWQHAREPALAQARRAGLEGEQRAEGLAARRRIAGDVSWQRWRTAHVRRRDRLARRAATVRRRRRRLAHRRLVVDDPVDEGADGGEADVEVPAVSSSDADGEGGSPRASPRPRRSAIETRRSAPPSSAAGVGTSADDGAAGVPSAAAAAAAAPACRSTRATPTAAPPPPAAAPGCRAAARAPRRRRARAPPAASRRCASALARTPAARSEARATRRPSVCGVPSAKTAAGPRSSAACRLACKPPPRPPPRRCARPPAWCL